MSDTDHPRYAGTHRAGHHFRAWRKEDYLRGASHGRWTEGLPTKPTLSKRAAIAEGLADYEAMQAEREGFWGASDLEIALEMDNLRLLPEEVSRWTSSTEPDFTEEDRWMALEARRQGRLVAMALDMDERVGRREQVIRQVGLRSRRRAAKRPISRLSAPAFDPSLVSRSLSPAGAR